ncbi:MAG: hypothetical protein K0R14_910 [Burkholderiales bacterium]|nr:hypothetical protein [Burkholderiales bacterium]
MKSIKLTHLCIFMASFIYAGLAWGKETVTCEITLEGNPYRFKYEFHAGKFKMLEYPGSWSGPNTIATLRGGGYLQGFTMDMNDISDAQKLRFLQFKRYDLSFRNRDTIAISVYTQDAVNGKAVQGKEPSLSSNYRVDTSKSNCFSETDTPPATVELTVLTKSPFKSGYTTIGDK